MIMIPFSIYLNILILITIFVVIPTPLFIFLYVAMISLRIYGSMSGIKFSAHLIIFDNLFLDKPPNGVNPTIPTIPRNTVSCMCQGRQWQAPILIILLNNSLILHNS